MSDASDEELTFRSFSHVPSPKDRPYRLSEVFTFLLKQQSDAFAEFYSQESAAREFRACLLARWTDYLSVTGELGPKIRRTALERVKRAKEEEADIGWHNYRFPEVETLLYCGWGPLLCAGVR